MIRQILFFILSFLSLQLKAFTVQEYFSILRERNHMMLEEQTRLESSKAQVATYWNSPELSISEMNAKTPFIDGEMKMLRSLEISQMFPNPWRVSANSDLKAGQIVTQETQIELTFKKIKNEGFNLYLELYKNKEERGLLLAKKNLIENILARINSAQVQGQEERLQNIDAHSDLNELKIFIEQNSNEKERIVRMMNQLMGRELNSPIENLEMPDVILSEKDDLKQNLDLKNLDAKLAEMKSEWNMKKADFFPEISLKVRINKSYSEKIDNSKELMIGLTLPFVFFKQQEDQALVAWKKAEAMGHYRVGLESEILMKKTNLKTELSDLSKMIKFFKENALPIKERKLKVLGQYSNVDMRSLMNFKMAIDDYFMAKMKLLEREIELQKKYYQLNELYL